MDAETLARPPARVATCADLRRVRPIQGLSVRREQAVPHGADQTKTGFRALASTACNDSTLSARLNICLYTSPSRRRPRRARRNRGGGTFALVFAPCEPYDEGVEDREQGQSEGHPVGEPVELVGDEGAEQ